ncbi:hypothetical protein Zm00014a_018984 [Zea mays]|jgi:hypothetical protein|uniref:Uncharacterized protein n=1 Tax=Zea mays TaxID=4577 RepID=A0A317Y9X1_MAIZE|nr:hypothetical protein Zm00014a_018984 [Zea mays]
MAHRSYSSPPETFSPLFSLLCPWIHGLFPAIEFVVAFYPTLPNSGDPEATLDRASLNSGDPTAAERNSTARSRLSSLVWSPPSDSDRTAQTTGYHFVHARPDVVARLSAPKPRGAGPARSARSPPLSLTLPGPPVSARPLARARPRPQI